MQSYYARFAMAISLLAIITISVSGFCPAQKDLLCGYRCDSNSCVDDIFSSDDDVCRLDFTQSPVTCEDVEDDDDCCGSGPGM